MSEPTCINLQESFGRRYRVGFEANGATKAKWSREEWPWLMEIRGRSGIVYPLGGEILAAMTDHPRIGAKLRALPCALTARGDLETVITFHVDNAAATFALIRPYRRRQISERARARLIAVGRKYRFGHGAESDFPEQGASIASVNGPDPVLPEQASLQPPEKASAPKLGPRRQRWIGAMNRAHGHQGAGPQAATETGAESFGTETPHRPPQEQLPGPDACRVRGHARLRPECRSIRDGAQLR